MIEFSYFLGIDQTGAAASKGQRAKPLKVCLAQKRNKNWKIFSVSKSKTATTLASLCPTDLKHFLAEFGIDWPNPKLAIIADCVFGMPKDVFPSHRAKTPEQNLWDLFSQTLQHSHHGSLFGLKVSEAFFSKFLPSNGTPPRRACEEISGSNSLFTTRPFQKNIQTGSYRIWRDLVAETSDPWLNVWPFVSEKNFDSTRAWIFEGYPSFIWRHLLGLESRNSHLLTTMLSAPPLKSQFNFDSFSLLKSDPDLCDAVVLALGGVLLQNQKKLLTPFKGFWELSSTSVEGWISGIEPKK